MVVTSLGIKREAKALGYAVQKVSSDEISNSGSNNSIDALVGKAAGVQITRSSGSAGGGSQIPVRWNYPSDELLFNSNAPADGATTLFTPKVGWDN